MIRANSPSNADAVAVTGRNPVFEQFAPAKINLYLRVGLPRRDGLHPLDSLAAFASIGDWVRVSPARDLALQITGPFAGALTSEADNFVLRAAHALAAAFGVNSEGAVIHLEKNLPIASGIGGGSADAAAALRALCQLWNISSGSDLSAIARSLGADVPVCLRGETVVMRGTGDTLMPAAMPLLGILLANTGEAVATAEVYKRFDALGLGGGFVEGSPPDAAEATGFITALDCHQNDLEAPAFDLAPGVAALKARVARLPGCNLARMSGSGGTVFGLFPDVAAAKSAKDVLSQQCPDLWTAAGVLGQSSR